MYNSFKGLFICFLFFSSVGYCQSGVELLKQFLESDTADEVRTRQQVANTILEAADPEAKMRLADSVFWIIQPYNDPEYYWQWHIGYNGVLTNLGEHEKATDHAYKLLSHAEEKNNLRWQADAYIMLYNIHMSLSLPKEAKGFLRKAFDKSIEGNEQEHITKTNYLLGYTYYAEGKNDSAIYYLSEILTHDTRLARENRYGEFSFLLARTHIRAEQYEEAIELLYFVMENSDKALTEYYQHYYHSGAMLYLSMTYATIGQNDSADYYFDRTIEEAKIYDEDEANEAYFYFALNYEWIGDKERSLECFEYLLDSTDYEFPLGQPALLYEDLNRKDEAIYLYKLALTRKDSNYARTVRELQSVLETNAEKEIEQQQKINEKQQELANQQTEAERQQKNLILWAGLIIGLVILFFGRMLFKRYKIIKEQKEEINHQRIMVEDKNREIVDSINYAKRIQSAILPPDKLVKSYLEDSFILYKPKDIVAGDFYWVEPQENRVIFAAADCTGHGVPGAMVSVICNNGLNRSVREFGLTDPADILNKTRDIVIQEFEKSEEEMKDGMDIALCSLEGNKLHYSGAHNPLWIIRKDSEEVEEIKADKQPIGKYADPKPFTSHTVTLNPGDTFYTFSDGFSDQFGGDKGKKFKAKNFKQLLLSVQNESMSRQKELIDNAFEEWKGSLEQLDDVCVIGVRF